LKAELHAFLTLTLVEDKLLAKCSRCFTPEERPL